MRYFGQESEKPQSRQKSQYQAAWLKAQLEYT